MTLRHRLRIVSTLSFGAVLLLHTPATAQCLLSDTEWLRSSPGDRRHGASLSMDEELLALGAPSAVPDSGRGTGVVRILRWMDGSWQEEAELRPVGGASLDEFGTDLELSGGMLLVGSPRSREDLGRADLFARNAGQWQHQQRLLPSREAPFSWYGHRVALGEAEAFVSAPRLDGEGAVFVFADNGTRYVESQILIPSVLGPQDSFGHSVAVDGTIAAIGAPLHDGARATDEGAVFVYRRLAGRWSLMQQLRGAGGEGDQFGASVALQGRRLVVGAPFEDTRRRDRGAVYLFEDVGGTFGLVQRLQARDDLRHVELGHSVTLDGDTVLAGSPEPTGRGPSFVAVFRERAGRWTEVAELRHDSFGNPRGLGSALALRGRRVVAGAAALNQSFAFDLPDLLLSTDVDRLSVGDPVRFRHCSGEPGADVVLASLELDGVPRLRRITSGTLDAEGDWEVTLRTPPGLAGRSARLASFSLIRGRVEVSNLVQLHFD